MTTSYTYDSLSRLLSVLHQAGGSTLDGASYSLDNAGNRTAKTDLLANATTNYGYDAIYELLSATGESTENYTYDPVGNRLSTLAGSSSYNSSNELRASPSASYTYDANGNTASRTDSTGTTLYTWDFENRLTSVTLPGTGGTTNFTYDPFGRRAQKSGPLGTTNFVYDGANIVGEYDSAGSLLAKYAQGAGVDEHLSMWRDGTTAYYSADGLASVTSLEDGSGAVVAAYTYDAFGNLSSPEPTLMNPFRYTGREWDEETSLYYFRARYYNPRTGRFLSEDPSGFAGSGPNLYNYGDDSPTNFIDPSGEADFRVYGKWCGPGWTGGRWEAYDPSHDHYVRTYHHRSGVGKTPYYAPPVDALDAACEVHDKCYYKCRASYKCDKDARKQCMAQCNQTLADGAWNAGFFGGAIDAEWEVTAAMKYISPGNDLVGENDPSCRCKK